MKIDNIDGSRLGYGRIYFGFSVDIPDEQYWRYSDTDKNYAILVEAILKFKEICEKQKESIENKKQIINNLYGYNTPSGVYNEAVDAFRNYVSSDSAYISSDSARARTFKDYVTIWEDNYDYTKCCNKIDLKKVNKNDTESIENNLETEKPNETTAFTSGEISW